MKTYNASDLKICGSVVSAIVDGQLISVNLMLWPDLWARVAGEDLSTAKLLGDTIELPGDLHIEVEDLVILSRFPPNGYVPAEGESFWKPIQAQVLQGFEWEEGFSYTQEEVVERDGLLVTLVHIVPDSKGIVPPIYSLPMLASFTDDSKPMEVLLNGFRYYSNVHKWKAGKDNGNS